MSIKATINLLSPFLSFLVYVLLHFLKPPCTSPNIPLSSPQQVIRALTVIIHSLQITFIIAIVRSFFSSETSPPFYTNATVLSFHCEVISPPFITSFTNIFSCCCLPILIILASWGRPNFLLWFTSQLLRPPGLQCCHSGRVCPQIQRAQRDAYVGAVGEMMGGVCVSVKMENSGDCCDLALSLCKYDLRKVNLFVPRWTRV